MKTEKELMEWLDSNQTDRLGDSFGFTWDALEKLFKGMKLVPADAVVLTLDDAELLTKVLGPRAHAPSSISVSRLVEAIEQAKGGNND